MINTSTFLIRSATIADIPAIQRVAYPSWQETYGPILSAEQLAFMLDLIYSTEALEKVITKQEQHFIAIENDGFVHGFAAYGPRIENKATYKLHKLYLLPECKGLGFGKALLLEVIKRIKQAGANRIELNVNRYNRSKTFYEQMGFTVAYEEDVPIGPYFMNDFVMGMDLVVKGENEVKVKKKV